MSIVITLDVTSISGDQATLNGELTTLNGAATVDVWFEYDGGLTTPPQTLTAPGPFSAVIDGRALGETVSYRGVASDGIADYSGNIQEYVHAQYYSIVTTDTDFNAMTLSNGVYASGGTLYLDVGAGTGTAAGAPEEDGDVSEWVPAGGDPVTHQIVTDSVIITNTLVSNSNYARELSVSANPTGTYYGHVEYTFASAGYKPAKMVFYVYLPKTAEASAYYMQLVDGYCWIALRVDPVQSMAVFQYYGYLQDSEWHDLLAVPHDQIHKVELVFDWTAPSTDRDGTCTVYINGVRCGGYYTNPDGSTFGVRGFSGWRDSLYALYPPDTVRAVIDHDPVDHGFPAEGTGVEGMATIFPPLNISGLNSTNTSRIEWSSTTPSGSGIRVETNLSTDGGATWHGWQACNNDGYIPELFGTNLTWSFLQVRITLTSDGVAQPSLGRIAAYAVDGMVEGGGTRYTADIVDTDETIYELAEGTLVNTEVVPSNPDASVLTFDGSNDYVALGDIPLPNSLTLEMWVKPESITDCFFCKNTSTGDANIFLTGSWGGVFHVGLLNATEYSTFDSPNPLVYGRWIHTAVVLYFDGVYTTCTQYEGGEVVAEGKVLGAIADTGGPTQIGMDYDSGLYKTNYFKGQIGEIRLWNTALSQESIQERMYTYLTGTEDGLIAYYDFASNSDNLLIDKSGNGYDGNIIGPTWSTANFRNVGDLILKKVSDDTYPSSGYRISPDLDLSSIFAAESSRVVWSYEIPPNTEVTITSSLSFDGGATWSNWTPISEIGIEGLVGKDLRNAKLRVQQYLETTDTAVTPILDYINVFIFGTESITPGGSLTPGDIVDGDIFVGTLGDYDIFVANATWRVAREWASGALYGTDSTLSNISMVSEADPQSGYDNTLTLVSNFTDADAAQYCYDNGYFLPNKEELNLIYNNADLIDNSDTSGGTNLLGSIASGTVTDTDNGYSGTEAWTSTEYDAYLTWARSFTDGAQDTLSKYQVRWVIPVRRVLSTTSEEPTIPTGTGSVFVKNNGIWKQATVFVNDGGVWKQPEVYVNDDGTWKQC